MNNYERGQYEFKEVSNRSTLKASIEALLFVSGDPLELRDIASHLEISTAYAKDLLDELTEDYKFIERGIKLICINGAYQLVTKNEYDRYIQKLLKKNKRQSLSQASLESLAIIAYKQPITRIDIDEIRGVKSESAIQKLVERDLIKDVGRLEVPGRPILYGTTEEFLRQFGLQGLNELPSLDLFILEEEEAKEAAEKEAAEKEAALDEDK